MNRRRILAGAIAAPFVARMGLLMPVRPVLAAKSEIQEIFDYYGRPFEPISFNAYDSHPLGRMAHGGIIDIEWSLPLYHFPPACDPAMALRDMLKEATRPPVVTASSPETLDLFIKHLTDDPRLPLSRINLRAETAIASGLDRLHGDGRGPDRV